MGMKTLAILFLIIYLAEKKEVDASVIRSKFVFEEDEIKTIEMNKQKD